MAQKRIRYNYDVMTTKGRAIQGLQEQLNSAASELQQCLNELPQVFEGVAEQRFMAQLQGHHQKVKKAVPVCGNIGAGLVKAAEEMKRLEEEIARRLQQISSGAYSDR